MIFLNDNEYNEEKIKTACGVGVTYKSEDISSYLKKFLEENP